MWDFRCPQLAGWAGSLLPEQPNCQGNQTAPTPFGIINMPVALSWMIFVNTRGIRLNVGKA